jgi:hypothetical protein
VLSCLAMHLVGCMSTRLTGLRADAEEWILARGQGENSVWNSARPTAPAAPNPPQQHGAGRGGKQLAHVKTIRRPLKAARLRVDRDTARSSERASKPDGRSPSTTVADMLRSLAACADPQRSSAFEGLLVRPNTVQVAIHDSLLSCVGIARGRNDDFGSVTCTRQVWKTLSVIRQGD